MKLAGYQNNMRYGRPGNMYQQRNMGCGCERRMPERQENSCQNEQRTPERRENECCNEQRTPLAMAYVPWQKWRGIYDVCEGFQRGTIFRELDMPFEGRGGCNR